MNDSRNLNWIIQCPFCNQEIKTHGEKLPAGTTQGGNSYIVDNHPYEFFQGHCWLKHPEKSGTFKVKDWAKSDPNKVFTENRTIKSKAEHEQEKKERFTPTKYEATASKGVGVCGKCYQNANRENPHHLSDQDREDLMKANVKEGRIITFPWREPIGPNQYRTHTASVLTCWNCCQEYLEEKMRDCAEWEVKRLSTLQNAMNKVLSREAFEVLAEEQREIKEKNSLPGDNARHGILRECPYCHQNRGMPNDYGDDRHDFYCVKTQQNKENSPPPPIIYYLKRKFTNSWNPTISSQSV
jgi:hypothetical protein